ncbi:hypothetical protein BCV63_04260 [Cylindrospermopsis raciborskii CS-508]|nr:hypothetical protein ASL19_07720 [Cylindrospermopsis sp. CR12]OHY34260.1 hypothetical protein BCV63_04260 [Cylindrospermopsis raciborskii CS-508]
MNSPQLPYSPLRPQTTMAMDHVKTTISDTQPSVKIIVLLFKNKPHFLILSEIRWQNSLLLAKLSAIPEMSALWQVVENCHLGKLKWNLINNF